MNVFCLHGFTGSPASWDAVRDTVRDKVLGHSLFCPELLGHGASRSTSASFEDEVDALADLVRQSGPPVLAAGYSQGGRLALGLLIRHPDLCQAGLLIGASPGLRTEAERAARREADERLAQRLENDGLEVFLETWRSLPLFASQQRLPAARLRRQEAIRSAHQPTELARALRILGLGAMPNYWDALTKVEHPVRLMVGGEDTKFLALAEQMASLLPCPTVEIVDGAGHNLLLEAPERVAAAISRNR